MRTGVGLHASRGNLPAHGAGLGRDTLPRPLGGHGGRDDRACGNRPARERPRPAGWPGGCGLGFPGARFQATEYGVITYGGMNFIIR